MMPQQQSTTQAKRRGSKHGLDRHEYLIRAREFANRGEGCTHSKLTADDVQAIRDAVEKRAELLEYIRDELSNAALGAKYGIHAGYVSRIALCDAWGHVCER